MSLILNLDTATENASVCLSSNGISIAYDQHNQPKDHASFIHSAIRKILNISGLDINEVDAIAVTSGPGSYTGLRVGMATAKGLCYALSKPLILVSTLKVMAQAANEIIENKIPDSWLCPMIDARRMEVFTIVYTDQFIEINQPSSIVLEENSFDIFFANNKMYFFGSGSIKWKQIANNENAIFTELQHNAKHLAQLATKAFLQKQFSELSYSEPSYLKEFYSVAKKQ